MSFSQGHALIIGVGADLPNTVNDAQGVGGILTDEERCAYLREQVAILTQQQADRNGILAGLTRLAQTTNAESTVVVYFSGHGLRATTAGKTHHLLLPYGYALDRLIETTITDVEFTAALKRIAAQKLLVLLDCCHAAGLDEIKSPGLMLQKSPMPPETEKYLAAGKGRASIMSSRAGEVSFAGKPYSAFTLALLEGLTGSGCNEQDGYVRVGDLAMYTSWRVASRTRDRQHPVFHFEGDNFRLAYYAGGSAAPKGPPFAVPTEIEPEPGAWRQEPATQDRPSGTGSLSTVFHQPDMRAHIVTQAARDIVQQNISPSGAPRRRRRKD
jgi:uncharacterized caspase-like protein